MSTLPSTENRKQPSSVYTVMQLLSMIFMLIAVIAMWIEFRRWQPEYYRTGAATPTVMVVPADADVFV